MQRISSPSWTCSNIFVPGHRIRGGMEGGAAAGRGQSVAWSADGIQWARRPGGAASRHLLDSWYHSCISKVLRLSILETMCFLFVWIRITIMDIPSSSS